MKRSLTLLSASLILGLNGCASWFGKEAWFLEEDQYLNSHLDKPLTLPATIPAAVQDDEFAVPGLPKASAQAPRGKQLGIEPPTLVLSAGRDVLVDSTAYLPVLTFSQSPQALFQRLQAFTKSRDIPVARANAETGVIETDWIEQGEPGLWDRLWGDVNQTRSRYELKVKPDGESGKGALTVEQVAVETNTGDGWQKGAPTRAGGVAMLNRYLAWNDDQEQRAARARVLAEKKGFELHMGTNSSDVPAMVADASFQRVWERVPAALEPLGFTIDDKDQSLGTYFVKYDGPPNSGFFSSLAFWRGHGDVPKLDLAEEKYQFKLEENGDKTAIIVLNAKEKPLSAESLEKILPTLSQAFQNPVDAGDHTPRRPIKRPE